MARKKKSQVQQTNNKKGIEAVGVPRRARNPAEPRWNFGLKEISTPYGSAKGLSLSSRSDTRTVGVAPRSRNMQVVLPRVIRQSQGVNGATDVLEGTEFLQAISSPVEGSVPGDILAAVYINPVNFLKTRISQLAELYQRYKFVIAELCYEPIANATQSGGLVGFCDYDPNFALPGTSEDNLRIASAHFASKVNQIWEFQSYPLGIVDSFTSLFTSTEGGDPRLIYQGIGYVIAGSEIAPSIALGNLYIKYRVELSIPQLAPSSVPTQQTLSLTAPIEEMQIGPGTATATLSKAFFTPDPAPTDVAGLPPNNITYSSSITTVAGSEVRRFSFVAPEGLYRFSAFSNTDILDALSYQIVNSSPTLSDWVNNITLKANIVSGGDWVPVFGQPIPANPSFASFQFTASASSSDLTSANPKTITVSFANMSLCRLINVTGILLLDMSLELGKNVNGGTGNNTVAVPSHLWTLNLDSVIPLQLSRPRFSLPLRLLQGQKFRPVSSSLTVVPQGVEPPVCTSKFPKPEQKIIEPKPSSPLQVHNAEIKKSPCSCHGV